MKLFQRPNLFKRVSSIALAVGFAVSLATGSMQVFAAPVNLINNPSVEVSDAAGNVANWTPNTWGTSTTTLTHSNDARTGTKALHVNTASRTDGDAKWIPAPIAVTPGETYTYSGFYKSTALTELDAMYTDVNGAVSYAYLSSIPVTSTWQQNSITFTVPATAKTVSVMHIITGAGSLTTDDFSLISGTPTIPPESDGNLLLNPSMEAANGTSPVAWNKNSWGTNTATTTYNQTGKTGGRSVTTTISNYTDGDAKWYADAVQVEAGKTYVYSDAHTSNVATRLVAEYQSPTGAKSYADLAQIPAAATWSTATTTFSIPVGITKVSIFHVLDRVGSLTIDDASLRLDSAPPVVTPPVDTTTIANPSVETSSNNATPTGWQANSWGVNTPTFEYVNDAHTGTKAVKTTLTSHTDGDAKWFFAPVSGLKDNTVYSFSAWMKSNTQVHAVAAFTLQDNTTIYTTLPEPQNESATSWQQYKSQVTTPANVKSATVFMLISSTGWVITDDYSMQAYVPEGFSRGLVTLTFDDGWQDIYTNGLPLMNKYGLTSTQYIVSGYVNGPKYMTAAQIKAFQSKGHEIGSHTVSHANLVTLTPAQLTAELQNSQTQIRSLFGTNTAFNIASPYGSYNDNVVTNMKKYYRSHRSTDVGFNSKDNFNPYNIVVQNVEADTSNAQVAAWANKAQAENTWLVLVYHQVGNTLTPEEEWGVRTADLDAQLAHIKSTGVTVKTLGEALDEITPQLR
jgi:peptidoglycan/xylan/chitin deacetylase (PgdA/CDA1 family)